jgi:hypothetical protein
VPDPCCNFVHFFPASELRPGFGRRKFPPQSLWARGAEQTIENERVVSAK